MSSNDKNKTPVSSPFNSPPPSPSPSPAPLFFSHLPPPPPYTMPFPISSAPAISSDFSLPPIHPPPPPSSSSSFFDLEFLQDTTTATITIPAPITTPEGGGDIVPQHQHQPQPQPLEWLHETPVPPFLSKTYDLVDDAGLDSIIGWGKSGHSFVVWDPVEFSRTILPRNFKHNNFSSFVRQLNTYGFRKIDADKWEFANEEGFIRGKKHLLRNIQRRKPSQSQCHNVGAGSSSYSCTISSSSSNELEVEMVKLREERSLMMQEVVQLQQQQRGTIQQMETVGEKLLAAEQRQKHMVSFLSKVFQNPAFLARITKQQQQQITSPRSMRKFVKHHHHQLPDLEGSSINIEGQMVKYIPDLHHGSPNLETLPELLVQEQAGPSMVLDSHNIPFPPQTEDDLLIPPPPPPPHEAAANDPLYKGKNIVVNLSPDEDNNDELNKEKSIPEFSSSIGIESMVKEHELWDIGFEVGMSSSSNTDFFWGNDYEIQKAQVSSSGFSDYINWELGSLQGGGGSGVEDYWPSPFREIDSSKSPDQTSPDKTRP